MTEAKIKKTKVAWGITGAGDKIAEIIETMKDLKKQSEGIVEIHVFLSKAAEIMLKFYRLEDDLRQNFAKVTVESNSNSPFLAGMMQSHKYEFLLDFSGIIKHSCKNSQQHQRHVAHEFSAYEPQSFCSSVDYASGF